MTIKKRTVYYCDYCGKHSLRSLKIHEKHCTLNPNRECRLCGKRDIYKIIPKYKFEVKKEWFSKGEHGEKIISGIKMAKIERMFRKKMAKLEKEVNYCPACILTVIRCNHYEWPFRPEFDFKKALEEWWKSKNENWDED